LNVGRHARHRRDQLSFLFRHLDAIGYRGRVGCEYKPRTTAVDGVGWHAVQIFETQIFKN
jgi:hydroxypyruvate isomerase